ncbi:MAG: DUF1365 domain-containing protein [Burkholderiaceae bacterium]
MASSSINLPAVPHIGFGQVRHKRVKPVEHAFAYATYFLMLPMRSMAKSSSMAKTSIKRNRWAALSFYDKDHGDGRADALAWLDELLHSEGIDDAAGEVWLHSYPRVFGYTFKPVSFWYCHRLDGTLRAIVVEVNNTFGERHCYLLDKPVFGTEQTATKVFHVSPFNHVEGSYRFRFMTTDHNTLARVDYDDATGPLLETNVSGELETITPQSIRKALWRYPMMTFGVIARIHWQAFKLWRKQVAYVSKPTPPDLFTTRSKT